MNAQRFRMFSQLLMVVLQVRALFCVLALLLISQSGMLFFPAMTAQATPVEYGVPMPTYQVGVALTIPPGTTEPGWFTVTGLPPGLTINLRTGLISGVPTAPGTYTITLSVFDVVTKKILERRVIPVQIFPFSPGLVGQFYGYLVDEEMGCQGNVTLTVGRTGQVTARVMMQDRTVSLSARSWSSDLGGIVTTLENDYADAQMPLYSSGGRFKGSFQIGEKSYWVVLDRPDPGAAGYYTIALRPSKIRVPVLSAYDIGPDEYPSNTPWGTGYLLLTVDSKGLARFNGRLADGTVISGSSAVLLNSGSVSVFIPLYGRRGVCSMVLELDRSTGLIAYDYEMPSRWFYPGDPFRPYLQPFQLGIRPQGARYTPISVKQFPLAVQSMDFEPLFLEALLTYGFGAFDGSMGGYIRFQSSTGLFSGLLPAYLVGTRAAASFYGVIITIPDEPIRGYGYYLGVDPEDPLRVIQSRGVSWDMDE